MTVYPASMPVNLALICSGAAEKLLSSGAIMKPCICGSCSGYGDIPATHTFPFVMLRGIFLTGKEADRMRGNTAQ